jgi:hypothetical protein
VILGMTVSTFALFHVLLSLVGIGAGFVSLLGMLKGKRIEGWTALFLATTVLTTVTGFLFPRDHVLPSHVVGVVSLVVLVIALAALYGFRLAGPWRRTYIATAVTALYLNVFVGVVQAFQKLPLLQSLAPTQSESPFLVVQALVLVAFVAFGILVARRFHPLLPTRS